MTQEILNMQVSVESLSGLQRRMTVQVPSERIESEIETAFAPGWQNGKDKGFSSRASVPWSWRTRYGGEIRREVINELMQSSLRRRLRRRSLQPAGGPTRDAGSNLRRAAIWNTWRLRGLPGIGNIDVSGLEVTVPQAEVMEEDIDDMLETLRKQRANGLSQ